MLIPPSIFVKTMSGGGGAFPKGRKIKACRKQQKNLKKVEKRG